MTIDLSELEQYFPSMNTPLNHGEYTFTIKFSQTPKENNYAMNLRIKQKDTKENRPEPPSIFLMILCNKCVKIKTCF